MTGRLCAIHQPNFFPWRGYFDKIARADVFVFLDDVAYPKSGSGMGSWVNRVRLNIQGTARWVGCPVQRRHGEQPISEMLIDDSQPWREKMLRTLEVNYRRCPNYATTMTLIEPLIEYRESQLADFNIHAIRAIADALRIKAAFLRQSQLKVAGEGTQLLIDLVKSVGGSAYLAGGGAAGYQQDELFAVQGIELAYQKFDERAYGPAGDFIPGLSVIDYIMRDESNLTPGEAR